jgi:putative transposase
MNSGMQGHLPRLDNAFYRGAAVVHWVFTLAERATGWLDDGVHGQARELMVHTMVRYELLCPVYCVMPDHMHLLWMGVSESSNQQKASTFFRRHLNGVLSSKGVRLQKQSYDHVLKEHERERNAFEKIAWYILENPVRAGLVKDRSEWAYSGCIVPGFPDWNPSGCHAVTGAATNHHAVTGAATGTSEVAAAVKRWTVAQEKEDIHAVSGAVTGPATSEVREDVYWSRFWREYERKRRGRAEDATTP